VDAVNVLGDEWDEWYWPQRPGYDWRFLAVGRRLGGELLGGSVYELAPGQRSFPYHWHAANEELLIVLRGTPTLRSPGGERTLADGDTVVFGRGPAGAHQLRNDAEEPARVLMLSTRETPEIVEYVDSGKVGLSPGSGGRVRMLSTGAEVDYWDGEE
jgi:uncharacterized cupin superfamily protein